jgi:hypothetical protein
MEKLAFIPLVVCSLILSPSLLPGQTDTVPEKQTIAMELYEGPDITAKTSFGNCQWFYPLDQPKEALLEQPDYKSDKLYYYAAQYGDANDNIYTIVLDESGGSGTGYDTLYVDQDNDNRIDSTKEKFSFKLGTTSQATPVRVKLTVSAGGKKIPYCFDFTAFPYKDENNPIEKVHANARDSSIFVGQASFGGKQYKIALADLDSNGLFNDIEQGLFKGDRFFVDLNGDGQFRRPPSGEEESFPYGKYTRISGNWYSIQAAPDGTTIEISPAEPQLGTVSAPKNMVAAELRSDVQFQRLQFSDGSAQAIAGTYTLATVELSAVDNEKRTWQTRGVFRSDPPEVTILPDAETRLSDVLPLQVSIEPTGETPSDVVQLEAKITGSNGGSYRCPRADKFEGTFEVQDQQGKVVASGKFEPG